MKKSIWVHYEQSNGRGSCDVNISYNISEEDDVHVFSCMITGMEGKLSGLPGKKFSVKARLVDGKFMTLYNEVNHFQDIDASLFIDRAFEEIIKKEKLKMHDLSSV